MSAEFLYKKWIMRVIVVFSIMCMFFSCVYAGILSSVKNINVSTTFYFLVLDEAHVEAGAAFVKLDGGAGYLMEYNGRMYVALSVYMNERDGATVQRNLRASGKKTLLIKKGVQKLYLKNRFKKKAALYVNALKVLRSYIDILNECTALLSKGITQEKCKSLLQVLERQFLYARSIYAGYKQYADICERSALELSKLSQKTIYLKDLRYLLCWQAEKYIALCEHFSL